MQQKNQLVTRLLSQGSFQKDTERDKKIEKNEWTIKICKEQKFKHPSNRSLRMKENINEVGGSGGGDSILRNNYQIFPRVKEKPQTELP